MSRRFCSTDMYKIPTISARIHPIGIEIQIPVTPIKLENMYAKATRSKADTVFVAGTVILCHKGGECIAKILHRQVRKRVDLNGSCKGCQDQHKGMKDCRFQSFLHLSSYSKCPLQPRIPPALF